MKNDKMELKMNEMDLIDGGYIVDCGLLNEYKIVNDQTGDVLDTAFFIFNAEEIASEKGVNKMVITEAKYKEVFHR
ncbi:MAG: hypothetical protein IJH60_05855 [Eubacterium sp.]|nr:hypothetical protein [Eubacterium sp.]